MEKFVPYILEIPGDMETPISLYEAYVGKRTGFLLESKEQPKGRYSLMGRDPFQILRYQSGELYLEKAGSAEKVEGKDFFTFLREVMKGFQVENPQQLPFVGGAVGTLAYDLIREFENIPVGNPDTIGIPDGELQFYKELLIYDHLHSKTILLVLATREQKDMAENRLLEMKQELAKRKYGEQQTDDLKSADALTSLPFPHNPPEKLLCHHTSKQSFMEKVKKALSYIYEGDIFQVVLSQRWSADTEKDGFSIYRNLRQINPSPYLFYLNFSRYQVLGSSPEMLTELRGDKVLNCPIAGTRKRGNTPQEDEELARDLLEDPKERAEHYMLVDLGRNDMGRIAEIGSVQVTRLMEVHKYSHVMHLVSLVEGRKKDELDMFHVLASFFPAGTLTGAPKIRAMEIIEELEEEKRGIYGGAVGYFGFDGNMDTCIAIRTIIKKEGKVYLQAGAGIVADSDPEKEYEETENKAKGMLKALL